MFTLESYFRSNELASWHLGFK